MHIAGKCALNKCLVLCGNCGLVLYGHYNIKLVACFNESCIVIAEYSLKDILLGACEAYAYALGNNDLSTCGAYLLEFCCNCNVLSGHCKGIACDSCAVNSDLGKLVILVGCCGNSNGIAHLSGCLVSCNCSVCSCCNGYGVGRLLEGYFNCNVLFGHCEGSACDSLAVYLNGVNFIALVGSDNEVNRLVLYGSCLAALYGNCAVGGFCNCDVKFIGCLFFKYSCDLNCICGHCEGAVCDCYIIGLPFNELVACLGNSGKSYLCALSCFLDICGSCAVCVVVGLYGDGLCSLFNSYCAFCKYSITYFCGNCCCTFRKCFNLTCFVYRYNFIIGSCPLNNICCVSGCCGCCKSCFFADIKSKLFLIQQNCCTRLKFCKSRIYVSKLFAACVKKFNITNLIVKLFWFSCIGVL